MAPFSLAFVVALQGSHCWLHEVQSTRCPVASARKEVGQRRGGGKSRAVAALLTMGSPRSRVMGEPAIRSCAALTGVEEVEARASV